MTCRKRRNVNYFESFVTYGTVIYYLPEMANDRCNYWSGNLSRSLKRPRVELERTRRIREESFANKFIDWHTKGQKRASSAPYLSRWTFASPLRRCTSLEERIGRVPTNLMEHRTSDVIRPRTHRSILDFSTCVRAYTHEHGCHTFA